MLDESTWDLTTSLERLVSTQLVVRMEAVSGGVRQCVMLPCLMSKVLWIGLLQHVVDTDDKWLTVGFKTSSPNCDLHSAITIWLN